MHLNPPGLCEYGPEEETVSYARCIKHIKAKEGTKDILNLNQLIIN